MKILLYLEVEERLSFFNELVDLDNPERKGRRLIYRTLFALKQMLSFFSQAIERKYQVVENIYILSD
ncbi:MAG: hypothetical protein RMY16_31600 [Nostoc sp. DedQUE12b]|uniref:hypothetical protein n=1 Tax=Nostoc sp. DedQUE12b TaxID=3075398 RepID=UPI002AD577BB|nr:hypothetical protein [Nostoc sp. DedQUE12b]MDZ8090066.1 hypothetical protein [Nostoc sp. DedQUE12b]